MVIVALIKNEKNLFCVGGDNKINLFYEDLEKEKLSSLLVTL